VLHATLPPYQCWLLLTLIYFFDVESWVL